MAAILTNGARTLLFQVVVAKTLTTIRSSGEKKYSFKLIKFWAHLKHNDSTISIGRYVALSEAGAWDRIHSFGDVKKRKFPFSQRRKETCKKQEEKRRVLSINTSDKLPACCHSLIHSFIKLMTVKLFCTHYSSAAINHRQTDTKHQPLS